MNRGLAWIASRVRGGAPRRPVRQADRRRSLRRWPAGFVAACLFLGSGAAAAPVPSTVPQASLAQGGAPSVGMTPEGVRAVVARYNRWTEDLAVLVGGGKALVGAPDERTRTFQFSLVAARPDRARVQGRWGNLTTLFDLAAREGGWTLFLPRDRQVLHSSRMDDSVGLLLPPAELTAVLLPDPVDVEALVERGAWTVEGTLVRLVVPPGVSRRADAYHRVLWIHLEDGSLRRMETRQRSQLEEPLLRAEYDGFDRGATPPLPARIRVDGREGAWASFEFTSLRREDEVDARRFNILVPPGTREIAPEDVPPDFLPEAEGEP